MDDKGASSRSRFIGLIDVLARTYRNHPCRDKPSPNNVLYLEILENRDFLNRKMWSELISPKNQL